MFSTDFINNIESWVKKFRKDSRWARRFGQCTSDLERFRIAWSFLNQLHPDVRIVVKEDWKKSIVEATKLRAAACGHIAKKDFEEALKTINKSLAYSAWPSRKRDFDSPLLHGLKERADMFFKMKRYDECAQDIDNIVALGLASKDHLKELLLQKVKALQKSKRFKEVVDSITKDFVLLKLYPDGFWNADTAAEADLTLALLRRFWLAAVAGCSKECQDSKRRPVGLFDMWEKLKQMPVKKGPHPVFKSASSLVELKHAPIVGRHFVAAGDFRTGDIVLVEPPFVSCVDIFKWSNHCCVCTMETDSPIPCRHCCKVVFCSTTCASCQKGRSHSTECKFLSAFDKEEAHWLHMERILVMRTLLMKTLDEWRAFAARHPGNVAGEADEFQGIPDPKAYRWDDYDNVYCLLKHTKDRDPAELLKSAFQACFIVKILEQHHFPRKALDEELRNLLGGLALRHLQNYAVNSTRNEEMCAETNRKHNVPFFYDNAHAVYPTYALFNYCCFPNLYVSHHGDVIVVRARRPIKKGEVLTTSSWAHEYLLHDRRERQEHYKEKHFYSCRCIACANNWGTRVDLAYNPPGGQHPPHRIKCPHCSKALGLMNFVLNMQFLRCQGCGSNVDVGELRKRSIEYHEKMLPYTEVKKLCAKADGAWPLYEHPSPTTVAFEMHVTRAFAFEGNKSNYAEFEPPPFIAGGFGDASGVFDNAGFAAAAAAGVEGCCLM